MNKKINWCEILKDTKETQNFETLTALLKSEKFAFYPASFHKFSSDIQEDIIQNSLLSLWQSMPVFDEQLGCSSWIKTICYSRYIDYLRKEKNLFKTESIELNDYLDIKTSSIEEIEIIHDLNVALDFLKEDETSLLIEFKMFGNSLKELSKKFGKSEGSLKVRISRILQKISTRYKD